MLSRLKLAWKVLRSEDGNIVKYAARELEHEDSDLQEHILDMARVFSTGGHSGTSAAYTLAVIERLLRFEPLWPLTGRENEWEEYTPGRFQNIRCFRVFKDEGGAYDSEGFIFKEPSGATYTSHLSKRPVTFPYRPLSVTVDVPENATQQQIKEAIHATVGT